VKADISRILCLAAETTDKNAEKSMEQQINPTADRRLRSYCIERKKSQGF
jgi:hypothetical protein